MEGNGTLSMNDTVFFSFTFTLVLFPFGAFTSSNLSSTMALICSICDSISADTSCICIIDSCNPLISCRRKTANSNERNDRMGGHENYYRSTLLTVFIHVHRLPTMSTETRLNFQFDRTYSVAQEMHLSIWMQNSYFINMIHWTSGIYAVSD